MTKYITFTKVQDEFTTHEFRGVTEDVQVTYFTGDEMVASVVSLIGEEVDIDALVALQNPLIECTEIVYDEFQTIARVSDQIATINTQVKREITKKYDLADEIAMSKRDATDAKRLAYEAYVAECIAMGDELKAGIGY